MGRWTFAGAVGDAIGPVVLALALGCIGILALLVVVSRNKNGDPKVAVVVD